MIVKSLLSQEIGEWLKKLRNSSRMTCAEVAILAKCEVEDVLAWEAGSPISIVHFLYLLKIYQTPPELMAAKLESLQNKLHF